jgi:hypothetical protein
LRFNVLIIVIKKVIYHFVRVRSLKSARIVKKKL